MDNQNQSGGREAEAIPEGGVGAEWRRSEALEGSGLDRVGPGRHTGLGSNPWVQMPMLLTSCEPLSETWFPHPKMGMLTDPTAQGCRGI